MKQSVIITLIAIIININSIAQGKLFDGTFKGMSNGISYTLYLKNDNGSISGTMRNSERATIVSTINATIFNDIYIMGFQEEKRRRVRFTAVEENNQIIWERKRNLFARVFSKKEAVIKYTKVGSGPKGDNQDIPSENDSQ